MNICCSFCGKTSQQVRKLIVGAACPAKICDSCVADCAGAQASVEHFTRAASKETAARGITVHAVGLGRWTHHFFARKRRPNR